MRHLGWRFHLDNLAHRLAKRRVPLIPQWLEIRICDWFEDYLQEPDFDAMWRISQTVEIVGPAVTYNAATTYQRTIRYP